MDKEISVDERVVREQLQTVFTDDVVEWTRGQFEKYEKLMAYYRCAMMEMETKLNVLNEELSIRYDRQPIMSIKSRLKKLSSIREKMNRRGFVFSVDSIEENLNDVAGVRVICSFTDDVYMLANALLKQDDVTLVEYKDYIRNPKPNGYRSLHLIVTVPIFLAHEKRLMKVELQIRTLAMDCWASLEHQLRYKRDVVHTEEMTSQLLTCADLSAELDKRMDSLRASVQQQKKE